MATIDALAITQLQGRIDAERVRRSLTPITWTSGVTTGMPIQAAHIAEIRSAITSTDTKSTLSLAQITWTGAATAGEPIYNDINRMGLAMDILEAEPLAAWTEATLVANTVWNNNTTYYKTMSFLLPVGTNQTATDTVRLKLNSNMAYPNSAGGWFFTTAYLCMSAPTNFNWATNVNAQTVTSCYEANQGNWFLNNHLKVRGFGTRSDEAGVWSTTGLSYTQDPTLGCTQAVNVYPTPIRPDDLVAYGADKFNTISFYSTIVTHENLDSMNVWGNGGRKKFDRWIYNLQPLQGAITHLNIIQYYATSDTTPAEWKQVIPPTSITVEGYVGG